MNVGMYGPVDPFPSLLQGATIVPAVVIATGVDAITGHLELLP